MATELRNRRYLDPEDCPHPPLTACAVCGASPTHLFFDHMAMAWLCEPGWGHRSGEPEMCLPEHHA